MANEKNNGGTAARLDSRKVQHATIAGIQLTPEQQAQIREASGVDIEWLLFQKVSGSLARDAHASYISYISSSWGW